MAKGVTLKKAADKSVAPKKATRSGGGVRAETLRQQVCAAASALFTRKGYGGTSMKDIADAMQVSRPALYYYFRDKNEIFEELIGEVSIEAQRRAAAASVGCDADPADTLRRMIADHADLILMRPLQFRILDMSAQHLTPRLRDITFKAQRSVLETFTGVIRHGIAAGRFRTTDPRIAAFALIGMCNWTSAWFKPEGRLAAAHIAALLAETGVNALVRHQPGGAPRAVGLEESLSLLQEGVSHLEFVLRNQGAGVAAAKPKTTPAKAKALKRVAAHA